MHDVVVVSEACRTSRCFLQALSCAACIAELTSCSIRGGKHESGVSHPAVMWRLNRNKNSESRHNLDYPGSVRWQHLSAPQVWLDILWAVVVITREALPQIRVETLIGSQTTYEIMQKWNPPQFCQHNCIFANI